MSHAPLSQKVALALVVVATVALLLPYAGCNHHLDEGLESATTERSQQENAKAHPIREGNRAPSLPEAGQAPLDQIEDLLSN